MKHRVFGNILNGENLEERLIASIREGCLNELARKLEGNFAIICDVEDERIVITDRFGFQPLYMRSDNPFLISDRMEHVIDDSCELSKENFLSFIRVGHHLEDRTWFSHVKLLDPASIYKVRDGKVEQSFYWTWQEVSENQISEDRLLGKFHELLCRSIEKRMKEGVGIALSGGLDSRLLFSLVNKLYPNYKGYCYTFGTEGCRDIQIARQVTRKTNWSHQVFNLTKDNWLNPRLKAVSNCEGQKNIKHMHGIEFASIIKENMELNLNGFLGDVVMGASYVDKSGLFDCKVLDKIARFYYPTDLDLNYLNSDYLKINKIEPYLIFNRGRRFVNMGALNVAEYFESLYPFLDNDLISFLYSLPDKIRSRSQFFNKYLMNFHRDFFKDIPWQKTNQPIGIKKSTFSEVIDKLMRIPVKFDFSEDKVTYSNYPKWIRQKPNSEIISNYLSRKDSHLLLKFGLDPYNQYLKTHMSKKLTSKGYMDLSEEVLRALTIEVYLDEIEAKFGKLKVNEK